MLGGTLLLAALLIASFNAQGGVVPSETPGNDFSWKPFLIMAGITLLLGGLTVAAHLLLSDRPHQRLVTSVFAAFALVALVGTIVATWDSDALVYLSAMLMLVGESLASGTSGGRFSSPLPSLAVSSSSPSWCRTCSTITTAARAPCCPPA